MKTNLKLILYSLIGACLLTSCAWMPSSAYEDYSARSLTKNDTEQEILTIKSNLAKPKKTYPGDENKRSEKFGAGLVFDDCDKATSKTSDATIPSESACRSRRNSALALLTSMSDQSCTAHLKTIYGNEATSNIFLGSLATVFTAASAGVSATTAAAAKTNYAVAGTIASAERSLVNDVVYKSILVPVIHQKILGARLSKRINIDKLYGFSYSDYPVERAIAAVVDYHSSCSFMEGLQLALKEGSTDTQVIRLKAQWSDAKTQLELADKNPSIKTESDKKNDPIYKEAVVRFERYSDALREAELIAAKVRTEADDLTKTKRENLVASFSAEGELEAATTRRDTSKTSLATAKTELEAVKQKKINVEETLRQINAQKEGDETDSRLGQDQKNKISTAQKAYDKAKADAAKSPQDEDLKASFNASAVGLTEAKAGLRAAELKAGLAKANLEKLPAQIRQVESDMNAVQSELAIAEKKVTQATDDLNKAQEKVNIAQQKFKLAKAMVDIDNPKDSQGK
jgi:hypothetical protein